MSTWLLNGYGFCDVADPSALTLWLSEVATSAALKGTVLVAREGVNLALCGDRGALEHLQRALAARLGVELVDVLWTELPARAKPFRRLRVRERCEIVTFGMPLMPQMPTAVRLDAAEWNALLAEPRVRIVDVRNEYEVAAGSFAGAATPNTRSFSEFRAYVANTLAAARTQPVALFCTGGIRCTKAGAYLRSEGFTRVYQLAGGVLGYLASEDADTSAWQGECFVFDDRPERPRR